MREKRTEQVLFRLTTDERERLDKRARRAGYSRESYIRRLCLSDKKLLIQDSAAIRDVIREIHMIGNNVNQIARMANSTGAVSWEILEKVIAWQKEIYAALHRVKIGTM